MEARLFDSSGVRASQTGFESASAAGKSHKSGVLLRDHRIIDIDEPPSFDSVNFGPALGPVVTVGPAPASPALATGPAATGSVAAGPVVTGPAVAAGPVGGPGMVLSGPVTRAVAQAAAVAEHSFLTDVADVREMEQGLLQMLDDFHQGRLQAFGTDCTFEKMDSVREKQERLARLHFDMDSHSEIKGTSSETAEGREAANKHLNKLMDSLKDLCTSIQNLQQKDQRTSSVV